VPSAGEGWSPVFRHGESATGTKLPFFGSPLNAYCWLPLPISVIVSNHSFGSPRLPVSNAFSCGQSIFHIFYFGQRRDRVWSCPAVRPESLSFFFPSVSVPSNPASLDNKHRPGCSSPSAVFSARRALDCGFLTALEFPPFLEKILWPNPLFLSSVHIPLFPRGLYALFLSSRMYPPPRPACRDVAPGACSLQ